MAVDEKTLQKINEAVTELRAEVEKVSPNMEKVEKLNASLDKFEEENQKMVEEATRLANENKEMAEKINILDKNLCKMTEVSGEKKDAYRNSPEYKALKAFAIEGGSAILNPEYKDYLRTDNNIQGGYTVHDQMANVILKQIEEISPVRKFARKWGTQTKSLLVPVRTGIPSAPYEGELESSSESTSTYRSETLTAYRQQATVGATMDILKFSGFNIETNIFTDANTSFAKTEGNKFLSGTGVKEPEGILVNASITSTDTTEAAGAVTGAGLFDDVIVMSGRLKVGYNPIYFFNKVTLAFLRTAKSTAGGYLWQVGGEKMPSQIAGFPYAIFQDMPSISDGAGSKIIGFGDLFAGYQILDSIAVSIVRDEYTQAAKALILFHINRWNTGQVAIPEAIQLLDVKAS